MKTYRVGIIGFGYIGKVHAFAHKNLPFFFGKLPFKTQITHVCTSRAESATAAGEFLDAKASRTTAKSRRIPTSTSFTFARRTISIKTLS